MRFTIYALFVLMFSNAVMASEGIEVVKGFVNAFNERDVDTMLELSTSDMRWMSINGQEVTTETANQAQLKTAMTDYFASSPSTRSDIRHLHQSGPFVYALEQAFWMANGQQKSQCSMAVYEFSDGKIQHVWYFPSHKC